MAGEPTRIGLLGGTFDPPHLGHLVVAEMVRDALELDEVRLLVAGDPWMKAAESPAHHRLAMAREAVAGADGLAVDARETQASGPTYTAATLRTLRRERPEVHWHFIVGADAVRDLGAWKDAASLLDLATFVAVPRPGSALDAAALDPRIVVADVPTIAVSSTQIRGRIARSASVRFLVPEPVIRYIAVHGLYRPGR